MKRTFVLFIIVFTAILTFVDIYAENSDDWTSMKKNSEMQWQEFQDKMSRGQEELEIEWNNEQKKQREEWNRLKKDVEQKWQEFIFSTQKDWVDYSRNKETRSRVDFKNGVIVLETVVSEKEPKPYKKAGQQIIEHARKTFKKKDGLGNRVLYNQIAGKDPGVTIDYYNLKKYLQSEIPVKLKQGQASFQSKDGLRRKKYTLKIDLVPEHIKIRAERYVPIVMKNSSRFKINPKLIMAVIHTESYFNPFAVSSCGAVGMMQIIPKFAGRDAYKFIYKKDKLVSAKYLYEPEKNIELGSAYLHILKYSYFKNVKGKLKNQYVSICGYNWGPEAIKKKILNHYRISSMTDKEVYLLLRKRTPQETRDYIKRVTDRIPIYDFVKSID